MNDPDSAIAWDSGEVTLADGARARVKLLRLDEARDPMRNAVRQARVTVELNGKSLVLTSATYHLPVKFGGVQIDCPIGKGRSNPKQTRIVEQDAHSQ